MYRISDTEFHLKSCKLSCCKEEPCIRKCCPSDFVYDYGKMKCVGSGNTKWTPKLFSKPSNPNSLISEAELANRGIKPIILVRSPPTWNADCHNGATLMYPYSHTVADSMKTIEDSVEALK